MNREETIKVLDDLRNKLTSMKIETDKLELKEKQLEDQLLSGSTFNLSELSMLLIALISYIENKYYVPRIYKKLSENWTIYRYYYLTESSKSNIEFKSSSAMRANPDTIYLGMEIDSQNLEHLDNKNITFQILLDKIRYNVRNENYLRENGIIVSSANFENRKYIKDFIYYLANAQTGKTNEELKLFNPINVLFDFLELEKKQPKTRVKK